MGMRELRAGVSVSVFWQGEPAPFRHEALISTEGNRWNEPGTPTVYFAGDLGLALIEAGRHLPPGAEPEPRALWTGTVETDGIVDVRDDPRPSGGAAEELWFLDVARARQVAQRLRAVQGLAGLIVPSAGSPDDLSRMNLVLYVDRLARPLQAIVREPRMIGRIEFGGSSPR
jgi:RES domain-containing protein